METNLCSLRIRQILAAANRLNDASVVQGYRFHQFDPAHPANLERNLMGLAGTALDIFIAYKFIQLLVVPFDKTDAYEKMQSDVTDVLKNHGAPYPEGNNVEKNFLGQ